MAMDAAHRRYAARTFGFMGAYVGINVGAIFGAFDDAKAPGAWLLALAVSAPVVGHIWATLALMRETDEFVSGVMARRFVIASGAAFSISTAWGFLETYADTPHAPGWLVYPLFWAAYSLVTPFVRTTR